MRIYEELYILKPDTTEEEQDASVELIRSIVTAAGGTIDKVDKWGMRKLAYKVEKFGDGFYILVQFSAQPETVKELERRLRVSDSVLKYLTVRIDEKLKWLEKRKKVRDKRAARKPPAPQALPANPVPAVPAMPAAPMPAAPMPAAPVPAAPPPAEPIAAAPEPETAAEVPVAQE